MVRGSAGPSSRVIVQIGIFLGVLSSLIFLIVGLKQTSDLWHSGQHESVLIGSIILLIGMIGNLVLWRNLRNYFGRLQRIPQKQRVNVKFASPILKRRLKRLIGNSAAARQAKSPVVLFTNSGIEILDLSTDESVAKIPFTSVSEVRFPVFNRTERFQGSTAPIIKTNFGRAQISLFRETTFGDWVGITVGEQKEFENLIGK